MTFEESLLSAFCGQPPLFRSEQSLIIRHRLEMAAVNCITHRKIFATFVHAA